MTNIKRIMPFDERSILAECISGKVESIQELKDREGKGSSMHTFNNPQYSLYQSTSHTKLNLPIYFSIPSSEL